MTPPPPDRPQKRQTLRRHGTLNPHPQAVSHPLFHNSDFFDSDDMVQVKYEMLRQVHVDNGSISQSANAFGFSRPSFYQVQAAFQHDGVFGLLPQKRGPQGGHKLTTEVMEFVAEQLSADSSLTPEQLAEAIQKRFRIQVHPRSIQRRLLQQKKRR
jgi:transposase